MRYTHKTMRTESIRQYVCSCRLLFDSQIEEVRARRRSIDHENSVNDLTPSQSSIPSTHSPKPLSLPYLLPHSLDTFSSYSSTKGPLPRRQHMIRTRTGKGGGEGSG